MRPIRTLAHANMRVLRNRYQLIYSIDASYMDTDEPKLGCHEIISNRFILLMRRIRTHAHANLRVLRNPEKLVYTIDASYTHSRTCQHEGATKSLPTDL